MAEVRSEMGPDAEVSKTAPGRLKLSRLRFVPPNYVLMVCLIVLSTLSPCLSAQSAPPLPNVSEEYLKSAADSERSAIGLPALRIDEALSDAARQHALRMADCRCISHQFRNESDLAARAGASGARFTRITENVAQAPSAIKIHQAWMHSEGHRHNLLDPAVDSVGIAVVERNGQMFAVEDFMRATASMSFAQQEERVAAALQSFHLTFSAPDSEARKVCEGDAPTQGKTGPDFVVRYTTADLDTLPDTLTTRLHSVGFRSAVVAACSMPGDRGFAMYRIAILLYRD